MNMHAASSAIPEQEVSRRHVLVAVLAVAVSLGIHGLLIHLAPVMPLGRPSYFEQAAPRTSFELRDVEFSPPDQNELQAPAELFTAESVPVDGPGEDFSAGALSEHAGNEEVALEGQRAPAAVYRPAGVDDAWEPRADILRLMEEDVFLDEAAVLPRRFTPEVPREVGVPDWVPPVMNVEQAVEAPAGSARPEAGTVLGMTSQPASIRSLESNAAIPAEQFPAVADLLEDHEAVATDLNPVEQMLVARASAFLDRESGERYFRIRIEPERMTSLTVLPRHVLFVQDCSESMTRAKLERCKEGLHRSLERLNEGDSFNIMAFRDQSVLCFPEWQQVSPASLARARWFIENMRASGRTDVYASLKKALETPVPAGGVGTLILVTDGRPTMGVVDSSDIIEQFSGRNDGRYSVFAVGGGRRVNRYLLDLISFRNRGDSLVVRERKDIPDALVDWSEEVRRPVLTDFHFQFSGVDEAMIYPQALTHLYLGRPLDFYGKCPESIDSLTFQLVGNHGAERYDMIFEVNFNQAMQGDASLREGWAWHRIYYLIGEHIRTRDPVVNQQIEQVAKEYDLVVPYGRKYPLP